MKIAILDDFQDAVRHLPCFEKMRHHDVKVLNQHVQDPHELARQLEGVQALILIRERSWIQEEVLALLPQLRLIVQTGKAGRHLDLEACRRRGIVVQETQGTSIATVEFTLLMVLAALRHFPQEVDHMRQGLWQRTLGRQLHGRTLAILGLGRIGERLAHVAQAMNAHILVWGRQSSLDKAAAQGWEVAPSRSDFFARADVLCITLRLNEHTQGHVTADDLAHMKPDAILVNTARAELIEPNALHDALVRGRPGFAAVDVYEQEPVTTVRHPLQDLPNCLCTPHLGFAERDNFEHYFSQAFDHINAFANEASKGQGL
jgi:D-3-phosphoglycerate dehydrogenase